MINPKEKKLNGLRDVVAMGNCAGGHGGGNCGNGSCVCSNCNCNCKCVEGSEYVSVYDTAETEA